MESSVDVGGGRSLLVPRSSDAGDESDASSLG
jgi:hypothetical protein